MSYEMYRYIFYGALIACGVFFVLAVVLFFTLKIPKVISDLSGRTARKAIEQIRKQNEKSGDKAHQSSAVNRERGRLTDKISQSGRLMPRAATPFGTGIITRELSSMEQPAGETDVLYAPAGETDVLAPAGGETEVLTVAEQPAQAFAVEYEITFIHTSEVIS